MSRIKVTIQVLVLLDAVLVVGYLLYIANQAFWHNRLGVFDLLALAVLVRWLRQDLDDLP